MPNFISEDDIEQAILKKLKTKLGYNTLNCYTVNSDDLNDKSNRTDKRDVILYDRLKAAAIALNPDIPEVVTEQALTQLTVKRSAMSPLSANRELDTLIRDGISVNYENSEGKLEHTRVRVLNFNEPQQNHFLAVSQLWIKGAHTIRSSDRLHESMIFHGFIKV